MAYTIRRWLTFDGNMNDDSQKVNTAEDAIIVAIRFAGMFQNIITEDIKGRIRDMEPGESIRIGRPKLKLTIRIKRTKT